MAIATLKLGPTSGPKDKVYDHFEKMFDSFTEDEMEKILDESKERIGLLAPEDDITREFQSRAKAFFGDFFTASSTASFQRGDYLEFSRILRVRAQHSYHLN
jgi:hypothetical protein